MEKSTSEGRSGVGFSMINRSGGWAAGRVGGRVGGSLRDEQQLTSSR
jgi:hypothetical protein